MNNLVHSTLATINQCFIPFVALRHIHQFKFGLATLSLPTFERLNSNARIWGGYESRSTAESKMYRLVNNKRMQTIGIKLLQPFSWITPGNMVNIDFSTFSAGWMYP